MAGRPAAKTGNAYPPPDESWKGTDRELPVAASRTGSRNAIFMETNPWSGPSNQQDLYHGSGAGVLSPTCGGTGAQSVHARTAWIEYQVITQVPAAPCGCRNLCMTYASTRPSCRCLKAPGSVPTTANPSFLYSSTAATLELTT